jgi:ABC-type multidrug transport system ATPase subunit
MSNNLVLTGEYKLNGVLIDNFEDYSNQIGYVMQEDALLGTLTPY